MKLGESLGGNHVFVENTHGGNVSEIYPRHVNISILFSA